MIIIHPNSKIGKSCTIFHEVTLGCIEQKSQKSPILEDEVYIGCKSTVLGEIILGKASVIGACSFVLVSTPPGSKVIGVYKERVNYHNKKED